MQLALDGSDGKTIRKYEPGNIQIDDVTYRHSIIVHAKDVSSWAVNNIDELNEALLQPLLDHQPDIILIGTGDAQAFLPPALSALMLKKGIGCEVMNSSAACRTYNVLLSEHRAVVAGIIV